jgi:uracil DNA glycosylase
VLCAVLLVNVLSFSSHRNEAVDLVRVHLLRRLSRYRQHAINLLWTHELFEVVDGPRPLKIDDSVPSGRAHAKIDEPLVSQ